MSKVWWWFRRRFNLGLEPAPTDPLAIISLEPDTAPSGTPLASLTVRGTGFTPSSRVRYVSVPVPSTTFVDAQTLTTGQINLGGPATRPVDVVDGTETSNSLSFIVT